MYVCQKWYLDVHLDDRLAYHRRSKEGPKWDEEVTTGDPRQIKQRIGDLYRYSDT